MNVKKQSLYVYQNLILLHLSSDCLIQFTIKDTVLLYVSSKLACKMSYKYLFVLLSTLCIVQVCIVVTVYIVHHPMKSCNAYHTRIISD